MSAVSSSRFPEVPSTADYASVIANAKRQHTDNYQAMQGKLEAINGLIPTWKERHMAIENGTIQPMPQQLELERECKEKINRYIDLHQPKEAIPKILKVYDEALSYLLPELAGLYGFRANVSPSLDARTIEVLRNLNLLNVDTAKQVHDRVFINDVTELKEQQAQFKALLANIMSALTSLKQALEPLAAKKSEYQGWSLPRGVNELTGRAAYVKYLVTERYQEIEREAQAAPAAAAAPAPAAASPKTYAAVAAGNGKPQTT